MNSSGWCEHYSVSRGTCRDPCMHRCCKGAGSKARGGDQRPGAVRCGTAWLPLRCRGVGLAGRGGEHRFLTRPEGPRSPALSRPPSAAHASLASAPCSRATTGRALWPCPGLLIGAHHRTRPRPFCSETLVRNCSGSPYLAVLLRQLPQSQAYTVNHHLVFRLFNNRFRKFKTFHGIIYHT